MKRSAGSNGKLVALRRTNFTLACAIVLVALAAPALAAAAEPQVLEDEPYYLGLHPAETESRGTVLTLHGGGWRGDLGPRADEVMADWIGRLRKWNYDVANVGYRGGAASLDDALAAFDLLRKRLGPREPICILGGSAGAHLALMVAARRGADVRCVVDVLGPPDLEDWGSQPAADQGLALAVDAFGEDRLAALSPIKNVGRISSPVLVAASECDVYVELAKQEEFVRAIEDAGGVAGLVAIESGDVPFPHCSVDAESLDRALGAIEDFLDEPGRVVAYAGEADSGDDPPVVWIVLGILGVVAALVATVGRRN